MHNDNGLSDFHRLLAYELRCAERYRRFVSVVMITSGNGPVRYRQLLDGAIRDSDEFIEFDQAAAVLMAETDQAGALQAIERYKSKLNGAADLRFSLASFPKDARDARALFDTGRRRLAKAQSLERGALTCTG